MRLTASFLTAAALILTLAPAALADSFHFTIDSSVTEHITNTGNDNIMGIYSTLPDSWETQSFGPTTASGYGNSPFSNIAFSVPTGNIISSITMNLILPTSSVQAPADVFLTGGGRVPLHPPDTDNLVSIAPTLGQGTMSVEIDGVSLDGMFPFVYGHTDGGSMVFDLSTLLLVSNNTVSTANLDALRLLAYGQLFARITSPGYNYASYIGGSGQVDLPYELEIVGTYSPVPEPSSIALLGTGLVGLAGFARRKFLS